VLTPASGKICLQLFLFEAQEVPIGLLLKQNELFLLPFHLINFWIYLFSVSKKNPKLEENN